MEHKLEIAIQYLDILLPLFSDYDGFELYKVMAKAEIPPEVRKEIWPHKDSFEILLHKFGYAIKHRHSWSMYLTDAGRAAKSLGGHTKYQEYLSKKQKAKERSDYLDLITKEFYYKSRYWPHLLSLAAFVLSIIAFAKDCNGTPGQKQKEQKTETKSQVTNSKIDTPAQPALRIDSSK